MSAHESRYYPQVVKVVEMAKRRTLELNGKERPELADHRDHGPRPYVLERCAAWLGSPMGIRLTR